MAVYRDGRLSLRAAIDNLVMAGGEKLIDRSAAKAALGRYFEVWEAAYGLAHDQAKGAASWTAYSELTEDGKDYVDGTLAKAKRAEGQRGGSHAREDVAENWREKADEEFDMLPDCDRERFVCGWGELPVLMRAQPVSRAEVLGRAYDECLGRLNVMLDETLGVNANCKDATKQQVDAAMARMKALQAAVSP